MDFSREEHKGGIVKGSYSDYLKGKAENNQPRKDVSFSKDELQQLADGLNPAYIRPEWKDVELVIMSLAQMMLSDDPCLTIREMMYMYRDKLKHINEYSMSEE